MCAISGRPPTRAPARGRHLRRAERRLQRRLAGEPGIDPAGEATRLHQAMHRQKPCSDRSPRRAPATRIGQDADSGHASHQ